MDIPQRRLCATPLAVGRTAEIFRWEEGRVLKLFQPGRDAGDAHYEADKAAAVHAAGLPAPAVYGVVEVQGRAGIVYEEIAGPLLMTALQRRPWAIGKATRLLAELQLQVHAATIPALPRVRDRLTRALARARLSESNREGLLAMLERLPGGETVCHGDFHPANVVLTDRGPVIIDWMDAARGHPLADVARTTVLLTASTLPSDMPGRCLVERLRRRFHSAYLRQYLAAAEHDAAHLADWTTVVAGARLAEDIPGERPALLALVCASLDN